MVLPADYQGDEMPYVYLYAEDGTELLDVLDCDTALLSHYPSLWTRTEGSTEAPLLYVSFQKQSISKKVAPPKLESKVDVPVAASSTLTQEFLAQCVGVFREDLGHDVDQTVPNPQPFSDKLSSMAESMRVFWAPTSASTGPSAGAPSSSEVELKAMPEEPVSEEQDAINHVISEMRHEEFAEASASTQSGNRLKYDSEMVQEQEQEQKKEKDIVIEKITRPLFGRNPNTAIRWRLADLANAEQGASQLVPSVFYPLSTFASTKAATPLPYPNSILLSENYAPFLHRFDLPRRLKNVTVALTWTPAKHGAVDSVRRLEPADEKNWMADSLKKSMGDLLEQHRQATEQAAQRDAEATKSTPKTFVVALSLEEAETLRRALQRKVNAGFLNGVSLQMITIGGLELTLPPPPAPTPAAAAAAATPAVAAAAGPAAPAPEATGDLPPIVVPAAEEPATPAATTTETSSAALLFEKERQCLRFFDNQLWFTDDQLIQVLQALSTAAESKRREAYDQVMTCRRRDRTDWSEASVSAVFAHSDEKHLQRIRNLAKMVREAVAVRHSSLLAAFRVFDTNGDGWLSPDELCEALLTLQLGLSRIDALELAAHADSNRDGFLNYREFAAEFSNGAVSESLEDAASLRPKRSKAKKRAARAGVLGGLAALAQVAKQDLQTSAEQDAAIYSTAGKAQFQATIAELSAIGNVGLITGGRITFHGDSLVKTFPGYRPTIAPRSVSIKDGQWYFEVVVVTAGRATVGFVDSHFSGSFYTGTGVGDDAHSWGFDGYSGKVIHQGHERAFGTAWSAGDILGVYFDADKGILRYSLNGEWDQPFGTAFERIAFVDGVCPAVSFDAAFAFQLNLGDKPFRYAPPGRARSIRHWIRSRISYLYALQSGPRYGKLKATTGDAKMTIMDNQLSVSDGFPSAVLQGCLLTYGKWYYEFTVVQDGVAQVGWADLNFVGSANEGVGCGDDKFSWGYDGNRVLLWFNGKRPYGERWRNGDVIGCLADIDRRTLRFTQNGRVLGIAAENIDLNGGLSPAITLNPCHISVNFGEKPFKFAPPAGYDSVHNWLLTNNPFTAKPVAAKAIEAGAAGEDDVKELKMPEQVPSLRSAMSTMAADASGSIRMTASSGYFQTVVTPPNSITANSHYPSLIADRVLIRSAPSSANRWYYEVSIPRSSPSARCAAGWALKAFFGDYAKHLGVGDDAWGWALVVDRANRAVSLMHDGKVMEGATKPMPSGGVKVISCLADTSAKTLSFWIDGQAFAELKNVNVTGGITPAVSLDKDTGLSVNFGEQPFKYQPPADYDAMCLWLDVERRQREQDAANKRARAALSDLPADHPLGAVFAALKQAEVAVDSDLLRQVGGSDPVLAELSSRVQALVSKLGSLKL